MWMMDNAQYAMVTIALNFGSKDMKNRKMLTLFMSFILCTAVLFGCNKASETQEIKPAPESEGNTEENMVGMPNPMVEVDDDKVFMDRLGIYMDTTQLGTDVKMFIYNDEMAEVQYSMPGMGDEDLNIHLRGSRSDEDISGIFDDSMEEIESNYGNIDIRHRYSSLTSSDIYDFEKEGIHYCAVISGEASQMQIAEIMDNVMSACGIDP